MGVTIDSLQIEIQSSSINASKGIDDLAASLGNLKKQTISKTAIGNLEQFSNVIKNFSNVHGASNALRTLANSIERLKSVGTVSSLTKSLAGLPGALNGLRQVDIDGLPRQTAELAMALRPLSEVKATGLNAMVRSLLKLDSAIDALGLATEKLNDEVLAEFEARIKRLDDILAPLAQKKATLQAGFKGVNTAVKQANQSGVEGAVITLPEFKQESVAAKTFYTVKFDVKDAGRATLEITLNETLVESIDIEQELNDNAQ